MSGRGLKRAAALIGVLAVGWAGARELVPGPAAARDAELEADVRDRTIAFFEGKYRSDPEDPVAAARLVDAYRLRFRTRADLSDLRRAREVARASLATTLDRAAALARLSRVRLDLHDFPGAVEAARRAVEADSTDRSALAALFDAALAVGDRPAAEASLASLPPDSYARWLREARWMEEAGRARTALDVHRRVCERLEEAGGAAATRAWCLTRVADLAHQAGDRERARAWLRRALEVWPGYRDALEGQADLAYAEERWERAGELYRRILTDAHPDLYLRLAEVAMAAGRPGDAEGRELEFLEVVAGARDGEELFGRPLALYLAGRGTGRRALDPVDGDLDRSLELARADVERRPTGESLEVLAWIQFLGGDLEAALASSDRARDVATASGPDSDYHRARILKALGRAPEARELYRSALADRSQLSHHVLQDLRHRGEPSLPD